MSSTSYLAQASRFLVLAAFVWYSPGLARAGDPVEDLKQALQLRLLDQTDPTPEVLAHRRSLLAQRVQALRTTGDLRRALKLDEWKDEPTANISAELRGIDADMRRQVGNKLAKALTEVARKGDATARLAVANVLAEMGPDVRAVEPDDPGGFARSLTSVVVALAADKDLGVRQEALRALGSIHPPIAAAVPVFARVLTQDAPGPRRLAAEGLMQLIKVAARLQKSGRSNLNASLQEVLDTSRAAVGAAGAGMKDPDPVVRRNAAAVLETAAQALLDTAPQPFAAKDFPPPGRSLSERETKELLDKQRDVRERIKEAAPLFVACREYAAPLAAALRDPDPDVRLQAAFSLERLAGARLRYRNFQASLPEVGLPKEVGDPLAAGDPLAPILGNLQDFAPLLEQSDVQLRRALLYFLESLDAQAVPLVGALTARLADEDRFVRWAAARTLANLPAEKVLASVPALGRLLADPDLSVRLAGAKALEKLGPQAREAVPFLAAAIGRGDVESRVAAMQTLTAIGPAAQTAVPQVTEVLSHADPRVRAQAALTLGNLGAPARAAVPALRRALGDPQAEVRINAGDALLNILAP